MKMRNGEVGNNWLTWQRPVTIALENVERELEQRTKELANLVKVRDGLRALVPPPLSTTRTAGNGRELLDILLRILQRAKRPMTSNEILELAKKEGWKTKSEHHAGSILREVLRKMAARNLVTHSSDLRSRTWRVK